MAGTDSDNPFAAFEAMAAMPSADPRVPSPMPAEEPSGIPDWGAPQQGAPSGVPDWGAPQQGAPSGVPDWGAPQPAAPAGDSPFPDFPGPGAAAPSREILPDLPPMVPGPAPAPPVLAPPSAKKEEPARERKPSVVLPRLAALAAQLVVVALIVVALVAVGSAWLNGGRVELSALSPAKLRELISPTLPLVAKELSNGLYETRGGKPVFFVRGEVENRGTTPTRVTVTVTLFTGETKEGSAQGLAGAVPTPEEFYSLQSAADVGALRSRLDLQAQDVAPGARVPFVVFFQEYPADLSGIRLDVALEPGTVTADAGVAREGNAGNAQP